MELVNHPKHYKQAGRKECIEEMRELYGNKITAIFCFTNAYKYLYRAGQKDGNSESQDIAKAKWYFEYARDYCKGFHCEPNTQLFKLIMFLEDELYND